MRFLTVLLAGAALVSTAIAQSSLAFTSTPSEVMVGVPVEITYAGGYGSPVTITLRKGDPNNLGTIGTLTDSATGGSYVWTPDASLVDGNDYALQITQGDEINYSGQFSLSGGASSISPTNASILSSLIANGTVTPTVYPSATTATASGGTGTPYPRNTTMGPATLTPHPTCDGCPIPTETETRTGGRPDSAGTGATPSSPNTSPGSTGGANTLAGSAALALCAFAGLMYLN